LNDAYEVSAEQQFSLYRFSTQRRHEKTITSIESALRDKCDSTTGIKFNGALEPTHGTVTEIGKERFLVLLKKRVKEYGQQTFYWIRDPSSKKVVDLFENTHRLKLVAVIAEHYRRIRGTTAHEAYDSTEKDEVELSRMVVESYLSEPFQEKIAI
jgi:hypothetical protein